MGAQPALELIVEPERAATALHPMRSRLLGALGEPDSAAGVARRLGLPRQKVNYHFRQLENDGLIELVGERRAGNLLERVFRATARTYLIAPAALGDVAADPSRVGDRLSSAYLAAVSASAIQDLARLRSAADQKGKVLPTLTLETEVRFATVEDQRAFADEMAKAFTRAVTRYHTDAAPRGRTFRFFLGGYPAVPRPDRGRKEQS